MTYAVHAAIPIPYEQIAAFCQRWGVVKLELFGSVLRDDFDPARSDVDAMVTIEPGRRLGLDFFTTMPWELQAIFGRKVDLVERIGVEESANRTRRRHMLEHCEVIYER